MTSPVPLATIFDAVGRAYEREIVHAGKEPEFLLLVSFVLSFAFIRTSAHLIRMQVRWWPGNVEVGGTHVHHLVWGILALLVFGYLGIALEPGPPWEEIIAVLFGVGAGLTLDEFALWLNLRDVYWSPEGRRSIDAVVIAAGLALIVLVGFDALWRLLRDLESGALLALGGFGVFGLAFAIVNALKGKLFTAVASLVVPGVGLVGAVRLARPSSPWARLYGEERMERARRRFAREGPTAGASAGSALAPADADHEDQRP